MDWIKNIEALVGDYAYVFSPTKQKHYYTKIVRIGRQIDGEDPDGCRIIVCDDGLSYRLSDGKCKCETKFPMSFESLWRMDEYELMLEEEYNELVGKRDDYYKNLEDKIKDAVLSVIKSEISDIPENDVLVHTYNGSGVLRLHLTVKKSLYSDRIDEIRNEFGCHYDDIDLNHD